MTVPTTIRKVIGIRLSAPGTSSCASCSANSDATDTATIPRGAIHAINTRSRQLNGEPRVEASTDRGRAMKISSARKASARPLMLESWSRSSRAASTINRPDSSRTPTSSLNWDRWRVEICRWLASAMPMTVVVSRPDSA